MFKTQAKWTKKITEIMWKINPNLTISERFKDAYYIWMNKLYCKLIPHHLHEEENQVMVVKKATESH